jgi:hypothetical protein
MCDKIRFHHEQQVVPETRLATAIAYPGWDAKGTPVGNDLTTGMYIWGDGSVTAIKRTIMHNTAIAPRMDGNLTPADIDAVAAYVWALGRRDR